MGHGTESAQVQIPTIFSHVETGAFHPLSKQIITLFPLATADEFTNACHKDIHGRHCPAIIIKPHVERFDIFWVIGDDNRSLRYLLTEKPLMLGLQVNTPLHGELERSARLFELLDRLGIGKLDKRLIPHLREAVYQPLADMQIEQGQIVVAFIKDRLDKKLDIASAICMSPTRSQNAISGSSIQNSARCRLVLEFSARKVGPKVYTRPWDWAKISA